MSEIDFKTILTDVKGGNISGNGGEPLSLGEACVMALDAAFKTDEGEGLKPKLQRGLLIEKISGAAEPLAIEAERIALIKERVATLFSSASLVRKICLLLDPATKE